LISFPQEGVPAGKPYTSLKIEEVGLGSRSGEDLGSPYSSHGEFGGGRTVFARGRTLHSSGKRAIIVLLLSLASQVAFGQGLGLRSGYAPDQGLAFGASWTASEFRDFRLRIVLDVAPKVTGAFVGYDFLAHYALSELEAYVGLGLGGLMAPFGTFGATLTAGLAFPAFRPTPSVEATYIYGFGENPRIWRFVLGLEGRIR
jgi:hypothetical protein